MKRYQEKNLQKNCTSLSSDDIELEIITEAYELFFEKHQHYLGHYFRNLYHTIRLINESNLSSYQKEDFSKILAAQLSSNEQYLLFYNSFVGLGKTNFKKLIRHYNLLDSMDKTGLLYDTHWSIFETK